MRITWILLLLLVPLVAADLGTFEQNTCVNIRTILNTTAVNISSISFPEPNNSVLYLDEEMTKNGKSFNYTFCDTSQLGEYLYDYYDVEGNVYVNDFEITYTGEEINPSVTYLYITSIVILILFGLFIIWFAMRLPTSNVKEEDGRIIQIAWAKHLRIPMWGLLYLCTMGVFYMIGTLGIGYLEGVFGSFFFNLFILMGWLGIPLIIILGLRLFDNILADKKIQSWLQRGIDVDGN